MEPWLQPKELLASVAVPPTPVRVPSQMSLALSVSSVTNDNEMIPGAIVLPIPSVALYNGVFEFNIVFRAIKKNLVGCL